MSVAVDGLKVYYRSLRGDVKAIDGVTFSIADGEIMGLAGESGCGKSTIANAILRLLPPGTTVSGDVLLNGEDVLAMRPGRLRAVRWTGASVVFQGAMHALNPVQRVGAQLAEAMLVHGLAREHEAKVRVGELLEQVGLPPRRLNDYPHELSGGQKQRVMIAMALACSPSLLIADEPTTALDVTIQAQILDLLLELQRDRGMALILITHDMGVVAETAQRVVVQYAGQQAEAQEVAGLFADPQHPYTAALLHALPERCEQRILPTIPGIVPGAGDRPSGCLFHPRCAYATDHCVAVEPPFAPGPRGKVRCHYPLTSGVPANHPRYAKATA